MLRAMLTVFLRDVRLALRHGSDTVMAVVFFILACILFPFGVGPEPETLTRVASGVIWVAALLATLMSLERLFKADHDDGTLELLSLGPLPFTGIVIAKICAHWLVSAVPLIAAAPFLALLLGLSGDALTVLIVALALGTPSLSFIGAVGAALVLGARRGGVLLTLIILPLYIPILIFGVSAVDAAQYGFPIRPHLLMLMALFLASAVLAPITAAAALRQAME